MALRYLSPEWGAELKRRLDASTEFQRRVQGLEARVISLVSTPEGGQITIDQRFAHGRLDRLDISPAPPLPGPALVTVRGPYATFAELNQGKLNLAKAFLEGKIKIEGNVMEAIRFAPALTLVYEIARGIETVY